MARVAIGVFEAEPALAEIHLARDVRFDHPLERAIHRGPTDASVFPTYQLAQIVSAQMAFLAQEHAEDAVALARALAAGRRQA